MSFATLRSTLATQWGRVAVWMVDRVVQPARRLLGGRRGGRGPEFEDRLVEGDDFDPRRADDWKKFNRGKTSPGYLPKVDD